MMYFFRKNARNDEGLGIQSSLKSPGLETLITTLKHCSWILMVLSQKEKNACVHIFQFDTILALNPETLFLRTDL